jgi:hypothetical protein
LHPFRESDQHTFVQQVWKNKIPNVYRDLLNDFVTELLQLTMQSLSHKEKEFTGITLQNMMLAEMFESTLKTLQPNRYNIFATSTEPIAVI